MASKQKDKGSRFERESAVELSSHGGSWKRIPGSGSLGTNLHLSYLTGDVNGHYPWFKRAFKAENKFGYGTSKQITIKRDWILKNRLQSQSDNKYPCLLLKFDNVTGGDIGSAKLICFNFDTWNTLMTDIEELYTEYVALLDKYMAEKMQNAD
jgi:hypothetical protein